jgi:hypothetical protein
MDDATKALAAVVYDAKVEQVRKRVEAEFNEHFGRLLLVGFVIGYDENGTNHELSLDPPVLMRVGVTEDYWLDDTCMCDDWYDPRWAVEPVEPHPALVGMSYFYVYAPSYNVASDERDDRNGWELAPCQDVVRCYNERFADDIEKDVKFTTCSTFETSINSCSDNVESEPR